MRSDLRAYLKRLRRLPFRIGFQLLGLLGLLSRAGGPALWRRCGHALGELHFRLAIGKRRDLERQLPRILGPQANPAAIRSILHEAYRCNERAALEIATMYYRRLPDAEIRANCRIDALDELRAALGQGRGVMLLGLHMGNGILMATRLAIDGFPVSIVYRESNKLPQDFLTRALQPYGIETIVSRRQPASVRDRRGGRVYNSLVRAQAFTDMLRALRRGRVLYVLMDQSPNSGDVQVPFLGKPTPLPTGPAELARRAGAPVLAALPLAAEPLWRFRIESRLELDSKATAEANTNALARMMDAHIRAHPQLWTWHHRRWRRYPFLQPAHGTLAAGLERKTS